jgi:hypothetical protein
MVYPTEVVKQLAKTDSERALADDEAFFAAKPKRDRHAFHETANKNFHELLNKSIKRAAPQTNNGPHFATAGRRPPRWGGRTAQCAPPRPHLGDRMVRKSLIRRLFIKHFTGHLPSLAE